MNQPSYDSLMIWLRYAPEDEVAEVLYDVLTSTGRLEEFIEDLDRLLAENPEH